MVTEDDLLLEAAEEPVFSNVFYGKCLLTVWLGKFPEGGGAPVRWVEGDPESAKRTMIDFMLDLAPGSTAKFPVKQRMNKKDRDWWGIMLPSMKDAGAVDDKGHVDLKLVKDHWVKIEQVEGSRLRDKNDPEKGHWNTYKFLEIYKDEDACIKAMALDNGTEPEETPAPAAPKRGKAKNDERRQAALEFCRVTIGTCKGMKPDEIRKTADVFIQNNPNVAPYVTVDDPEIQEMINEYSIPF